MFLFLVEFVFLTVAFVFVGTQVVTPLLNGTTLFPIFGRRAALETDLARAKSKQEEKDLQKRVEEFLKQVDSKK